MPAERPVQITPSSPEGHAQFWLARLIADVRHPRRRARLDLAEIVRLLRRACEARQHERISARAFLRMDSRQLRRFAARAGLTAAEASFVQLMAVSTAATIATFPILLLLERQRSRGRVQ